VQIFWKENKEATHRWSGAQLFDEHRMPHSVSGWGGAGENYEKDCPTPDDI